MSLESANRASYPDRWRGQGRISFRILRYKGTKILYEKHFGIRAERIQPVRPTSRQEGYNESIDGQTGHFERA